MFILRGEVESEACLVEVDCRAENLRSGAAFVFVDNNEVRGGHIFQLLATNGEHQVTAGHKLVTNV